MKRLSVLLVVVALAGFAGTSARAEDPSPPPPTTPPPAPATIAEGVSIGDVPVGGLTPDVATAAVRGAFSTPLLLTYGTYVFEASPDLLAVAAVQRAVQQAQEAAPNTTIPLAVTVRRAHVRAYVNDLAERFQRKPIDARLLLRRLRPWIAPEKAGREIDRAVAERAVTAALQSGGRGPLALRPKVLRPRVTRRNFGPVIVIRRGSNKLFLYQGMRYRRSFGVATGQRQYPTPLGRFRIVVKWKHPWWYPPNSPWAKDQKPIPPGPTNPLGTRWMGISSPGVGIHGTPEPGSIGYSVSHGCIRMRIPDAEWLFGRVSIGTTVFIVSA